VLGAHYCSRPISSVGETEASAHASPGIATTSPIVVGVVAKDDFHNSRSAGVAPVATPVEIVLSTNHLGDRPDFCFEGIASRELASKGAGQTVVAERSSRAVELDASRLSSDPQVWSGRNESCSAVAFMAQRHVSCLLPKMVSTNADCGSAWRLAVAPVCRAAARVAARISSWGAGFPQLSAGRRRDDWRSARRGDNPARDLFHVCTDVGYRIAREQMMRSLTLVTLVAGPCWRAQGARERARWLLRSARASRFSIRG